jgi:arylsulfatase A-like enzyme
VRRSSIVSALLAGASVSLGLGLTSTRAAAAAPNVLIIVTDDQRAANTMWVMPKTGYRFVRQGVSYPRGFVTTPLCCPSRATIFTGRYAHNTRVQTNGPPKGFDTTTMFPRLLRNAGYRTAMVGNFLNSWPLTARPPYFNRWALGGKPYVDPAFNINGTIRTVPGYSTELVGDFAIRFLRGFETNDSHPWFLYVAPLAPHHPWTPEGRYRAVPLRSWPGNPAVFERDRSDKPPSFRKIDWSLADGRRVRDGQLRTLMSVDDMVGRLFATLHELGETRDTLAFFLSDNGYLWADHHLGGDRNTAGQKRLPYTDSVRVPFFMRWLGHLPAGTRDTRLAANVDIAPTVLEAAGIPQDPAKPPLDGRSLLAPDARNRLLLERWRERVAPWIPNWASLRTRDYQYIEYYADDGVTTIFREYYDLRRDPWQLTNLLHDGNPNNDPNVAPLRRQLAADRQCSGTGPGASACP